MIARGTRATSSRPLISVRPFHLSGSVPRNTRCSVQSMYAAVRTMPSDATIVESAKCLEGAKERECFGDKSAKSGEAERGEKCDDHDRRHISASGSSVRRTR